MAKEIELSSLDLRYEGYRMKNPGLQERLLVSIAIARHRGTPGRRATRANQRFAQRFQALSLCAQAATSHRAVRLAGRGRSSSNHEPFADLQQQGLEHSGAGGL